MYADWLLIRSEVTGELMRYFPDEICLATSAIFLIKLPFPLLAASGKAA